MPHMSDGADISVSPTVRALWKVAGLVSLTVGVIGIFVPLLPTTVFLLLAAYCFQRGSPTLHLWLVNHPRFGPPIRDWREHGAISRKAKRNAMIALVVVFGLSLLLGVSLWLLALQAGILLAVAAFILTRPEGPRTPPAPSSAPPLE